MLTIRFNRLLTYIGAVYVLFASAVLLSPSHEVPIWWVVSAVVFLPSIAIAICVGSAVEKLLAVVSLLFVALLPFGFPGTLLGWGGSLLIGLQCGRLWLSEVLNGRVGILFWALAAAPVFCTKILVDLATVGISHEMQSNFFQAASINYANAVLLGSACLAATCMIVQDISISKRLGSVNRVRFVRKMALFLMPISLILVLAMDYRSGILGVVGLILFYASRFSKWISYSLITLAAMSLVFAYGYIIEFLVPGRDRLEEVVTELLGEDNRVSRGISFAGRVLIDKVDFTSWLEYFSVSALSDFLAVTFPLSIGIFLYFANYFKSIFKVALSPMRLDQRASLLLILASGLALSLLQPDFFNMFVLGFQASLIVTFARV